MGRQTGRPILLAVNADEEIGSIHSTPVWEALAREAQAGLVFESGGAGGAVVTARRGLRRYRLDVWGEARHAGFTSEGKRSALVDLAHRVLAIETLNDPERGLTTNVGRIEGGTATNIVPDHAQAWFEMRFWEDALGNQAEAQLKKGLAETLAPGVRTEVENGLRRPAMPRTEHIVRLYERARKTARRIGLDLPEERRLGASDANILANAGLAVLDGLGPLGNDGHSLDEYILADSLVDRIIFTAHLVEDLTRV
jgi:glutamate carboxypeptidase